ncbi:hypothetical protein [Aidingimonas halophila]|uniref:Uncharacterized protein n=1 Tax=Aidingimonas halophila TaxID=574349 RepID=A0A1H2RAN3_9GAMM|nr:hypothetical protein [Aidingimonas halophila]GHC19567.1 hypothetical protein GCM10008094_07020 [Aidingimonas halophila]SDW16492.1 hypothetical protein SAMN05443545_101271 [Aidingimonas halophila]
MQCALRYRVKVSWGIEMSAITVFITINDAIASVMMGTYRPNHRDASGYLDAPANILLPGRCRFVPVPSVYRT